MSRGCVFPVLVLALASCGRDECRGDDDCDDGLWCTGRERCAGGRCVGGLDPACGDGDPSTADSCDEDRDACVHECLDGDLDGHMSGSCGGGDCDDSDPSINPGEAERCDGADDDCDTVVDEDRDRDGFMNDGGVCAGLDPADVDCDDDDPAVHPGAAEVCDGTDQNCVLGTGDEADTDADGHVEQGCPSSPGGDDCDDEDPGVHPGIEDACNGLDDDCDFACDGGFECCMGGEVECGTECGTLGSGECTAGCGIPGPADCTPPPEICNGADDDCDDVVDEDLPCAPGEIAPCTTACGTDGTGVCTDLCSPAPAEACNPPAEECNGIDDDCNDIVDEGFECQPGEIVECTTACGTSSLAACTLLCEAPDPAACTPASELTCDDFEDNDCDGDEDCLDTDCLLDPWCG